MPADWRHATLGAVTDNFDGGRVPVAEVERSAGPYPYYGASGIIDHVEKFLFDGEYLLIAEDGENLRTRTTPFAFLASGKFWPNNHVHIVRANAKSDTRFLMHALTATDISGYLTGSTMPKLTQANMNRVRLALPPLAEQRAIAAILGAFDDKIECNRRLASTLESLARSLFDSLKSNHSWQPAPLDQIAEFRNGLALQRYPADGGRTLPVLKIPQLRAQSTSGAESASANIPDAYVVHDGDILFSWSGSLECTIWPGGPAALNQHIFKVVPKAPWPRWLAYLGVIANLGEFRAIASGKATTMGHIQRHHIASASVQAPPPAQLTVAGRAVASALDRSLECRVESRTLAALRDALLPKLISGEMRVAQAEKYAEAAL